MVFGWGDVLTIRMPRLLDQRSRLHAFSSTEGAIADREIAPVYILTRKWLEMWEVKRWRDEGSEDENGRRDNTSEKRKFLGLFHADDPYPLKEEK